MKRNRFADVAGFLVGVGLLAIIFFIAWAMALIFNAVG